ncbi:hypothetical protein WR25_07029 [Diploscapter pachys]|uniref:IST1 homolog n=1 Tax=Diploscapter pachys TaxID=2018661 RepID=A0A2A2JSA0_9BILA|nr:hypothetical protein WR25_07029 [Diploscapter pachys]
MSISWGPQLPKLKTNLRLAINRLKLIEKKKTELAMKARTEIADYISQNKPDRARIRVEHIIREDYLVEALEILEMYCDLLLARFGLIEQTKTLDDGIAEAVISVLWAAPRVAQDIAEFKVVSDQLTLKYGKPFAEAARANQLEYPAKVNPKLVAKLSVAAPPKLLVERYMIEIAASANVPFTPDPDVMREDEVHQAEKILIDFKNAGTGQGSGAGPGTGPNYPPPPENFGGSSGGGGVSAGSVYGWNLNDPSSGGIPGMSPMAPPANTMPPNVPYHGGSYGTDGHIYEVPAGVKGGHIYDEVPGAGYGAPTQNTGLNQPSGIIQLPKIGPNGLPIASDPVNDRAYPALSQRVWFDERAHVDLDELGAEIPDILSHSF